jgi:hypothetical protein
MVSDYCRFRKKPRKRRFELRNILISPCPNVRLLTFYEAIIIVVLVKCHKNDVSSLVTY